MGKSNLIKVESVSPDEVKVLKLKRALPEDAGKYIREKSTTQAREYLAPYLSDFLNEQGYETNSKNFKVLEKSLQEYLGGNEDNFLAALAPVLGSVSNIFDNIGSKSRAKSAAELARIQAEQERIAAKNKQKTLLYGGAVVAILLIIFLTFRK